MIAHVTIHGDRQLVEGNLDFGDGIQPAVGWEIELDYMGIAHIARITFSTASEPRVRVELTRPSDHYTAEGMVRMLTSGEFPEWTDVELGDYCYCILCPNYLER